MTMALWVIGMAAAMIWIVNLLEPREDDRDLAKLYEEDEREQGGGAL